LLRKGSFHEVEITVKIGRAEFHILNHAVNDLPLQFENFLIHSSRLLLVLYLSPAVPLASRILRGYHGGEVHIENRRRIENRKIPSMLPLVNLLFPRFK